MAKFSFSHLREFILPLIPADVTGRLIHIELYSGGRYDDAFSMEEVIIPASPLALAEHIAVLIAKYSFSTDGYIIHVFGHPLYVVYANRAAHIKEAYEQCEIHYIGSIYVRYFVPRVVEEGETPCTDRELILGEKAEELIAPVLPKI